MAFNKQKALKILNPVAAALFAIQALSGIFHEAIPFEIFSRVHGPVGFALALTVTAHIVLNWNWFRTAF